MNLHFHYKVIIALLLIFSVSCSTVKNTARPLFHGIPDEDDTFDNFYKTIKKNPASQIFKFKSANESHLIDKIKLENKSLDAEGISIKEFVKLHNTLSFAIIKNDTLLYEYYAPNFTPEKTVTSFSIAKSFIAMLIGIAIEDGKIKSVNQSIADFLPEYQQSVDIKKITIKHLLQHTSGIQFSKQIFNPWSDNSEFYYANNLRDRIKKISIKESPGLHFDYNSENTMLLALVLEKASGMSVSDYLEKKIWSQIDMEADAIWNTDRPDSLAIEKAFCCLNARTLDFAKFGRLLLNQGNWNGKQIIPKSYIIEATTPSTNNGGKETYGYNIGIGPKKYGTFFPIGLYGQLIYIYPAHNIIIVRFGDAALKYNPNYWKEIMLQIIDQLD